MNMFHTSHKSSLPKKMSTPLLIRLCLVFMVTVSLLIPRITFSSSQENTQSEMNTVNPPVQQVSSVTKKFASPLPPSRYSEYDNAYNRNLLAKIIASEYRSQEKEDFDKKIAIGIVVMNRVLSPKFPDSVEGVIFQKNQFQPTFDGTWSQIKPTKFDRSVVTKLFEGYMVKTSTGESLEDALYFLNPSISEPDNVSWFRSRLHLLGNLGEHEFYREH